METTPEKIGSTQSPAGFIVTTLLVGIFAVGLTAAVSATPDLSVNVMLDRDTIGLDEQALLQVEISGESQNLPAPVLPTMPTFEVYSQGRSSNISIVNGKVTSSVVYRYLLLPQKPGVFPIDQISVVYDNRRHKGNAVELTVVDAGSAAPQELEDRALDTEGDSRDYFMEAVVDKKEPFVNEQVTLTLKFYIAVRYYGSPELTEPTTTGFWTEVIGNKAPYFQKINERRYKVIERKYALFPTQTGKLTIGRAAIRTTVAGKRRQRRDPFDVFDFGDFFGRGVEVTARSRPITVDVQPLPRAGRPDDFTGTIGSFSIRVSADKSQVEVNQPVSVTIAITGTGNIKSVAEPVIPELDDFRIYRASSSEKLSASGDRLGGTKIFEEVFIPRRPGTLEIPSFKFNYFDPGKNRYVTGSTQPMPLMVTRPEGYVASPDQPYASPDMTIGSEARGIRHIKSELGQVTPRGRVILLTPLFLVVNSLPVLLLAGTVLLRRRREKLLADVGYARARGAARVARKRLAKAKALAQVQCAGEFYAEVYQVLTSYIADKLNISPHGLTTESIAELLRQRAADDKLVADVSRVIEECDFARFAPASLTQQDIDRSLEQVEAVMIGIEGVRFA